MFTLVSAADATTVWIDTDPAIGSPFREVDDAFAFLLAINSPQLEIAGVSTSYGNASLAATTRAQRKMEHQFGVERILVSPGARSAKDLGTATAATESLRSALEKHERLTYVALAPLTNLATFLLIHPELANRLERIIFVGGRSATFSLRIPPSDVVKIHDANVVKDPAAAAVVLRSKVAITLAPAEVSAQITLNKSDLRDLANSGAAGKFLYDRTRVWLCFWRFWARLEGGPVFDALPLLLLTNPSLFTVETRYAYLENAELIASKHTDKTGSRRVIFCSAAQASTKHWLLERMSVRPGQ